MKDLETIKVAYENAARLHSKASANGDYKTANKQVKILTTIFRDIENGKITHDVLLELLQKEDISIEAWAAAHLLGLGFEIDKAKDILQRIKSLNGKTTEDKLVIFGAEKALEVWEKRGHLDF
jgi:phenylalanyl-tRNA synthetase beta subunit